MWEKTWNLLTSLKLAIVLASLATLVLIAGSLIMHFHPETFNALDRAPLGTWYPRAVRDAPLVTLWLPVAGILILAFALNTLCCFCDWLPRIRRRWRKSGEYLIHLGFCLLVIAFFWGNLAGYRTSANRLFPGDTLALAHPAGYALRLDEFQPVFAPGSRRPIDMINQVTLLHEGREVERSEVRTNHPLMHRGLIVLPESFGAAVSGFRFLSPTLGRITLERGSELTLAGGETLRVLDFFPDAARRGGQVFSRGETLSAPAFRLELRQDGKIIWQGWHFLRQGPPLALLHRGFDLRALEPVQRSYSLLAVNFDPAIDLALAGAIALLAGVLIATLSYYAKRRRKDRPEVS